MRWTNGKDCQILDVYSNDSTCSLRRTRPCFLENIFHLLVKVTMADYIIRAECCRGEMAPRYSIVLPACLGVARLAAKLLLSA